MNLLYDSDTFVAVHYGGDRLGYEIINKDTAKGVYLDGEWALVFKFQCECWRFKEPTLEEVDAVLDGFTQLAQNPVVAH